MSTSHAEGVLYAHLTNPDSLDYLAHEGFLTEAVREIITKEVGRDLVEWALQYYFQNGRLVAPSKEAIQETWKTELERVEIVVDDDTETDSVQWAVEQLRSQFATYRSQEFTREFAKGVYQASPTEKVASIQEGAHTLYRLSQTLVSHRREADAGDGFQAALERHEARKRASNVVEGLTFGMKEIDEHIFGVHDGELVIVAAGSGIGKSWVAGKTTLAEWKAGRRTALFTLENDLEMTFDRLACMLVRVPYELWQRGEATDAHVHAVKEAQEALHASDHAPQVLMPERGARTVPAIVRKAEVLSAQSLIIDQLSFVEHNPNSRERQRWALFSETIHDLKNSINDGPTALPCLLTHQIKREGMEAARKAGRHYMDHLAEAAEIERTADFVFAVYQSEDDKIINQAQWQTLKARRVPPKDWELAWRLNVGDIRVRRELPREVS